VETAFEPIVPSDGIVGPQWVDAVDKVSDLRSELLLGVDAERRVYLVATFEADAAAAVPPDPLSLTLCTGLVR
jgi:hypothetical protein